MAVRWEVDVAALQRAQVLRGWTQRDLARAAVVDSDTVSDVYRARRRPTFRTILALCRVLDLEMNQVIRFLD